MELDFGEWELSPWDAIPREAMDHWAEDYVNQAPPNGETFHQLHQRAIQFLQEVNADSTDKSIIVVTHAGVIRALLAEALSLPLKHIFRLHIDYGSVTQLLVDASGMRVGYVNR
jgi:alpha-ribazole phosphatase